MEPFHWTLQKEKNVKCDSKCIKKKILSYNICIQYTENNKIDKVLVNIIENLE